MLINNHRPLASKTNQSENELTFTNKNATYQVYENRENGNIKKVGILVKVNGKIYDLKGDINSVTGKLRNVSKIELDNVIQE